MDKNITKKNIAQVCLKEYEDVLIAGKKDNFSYFKERLIRTNTCNGICFLYSKLTGDSMIYHSNHFNKYYRHNSLVDKYPIRAYTKAQAIARIKTRINILKSWI